MGVGGGAGEEGTEEAGGGDVSGAVGEERSLGDGAGGPGSCGRGWGRARGDAGGGGWRWGKGRGVGVRLGTPDKDGVGAGVEVNWEVTRTEAWRGVRSSGPRAGLGDVGHGDGPGRWEARGEEDRWAYRPALMAVRAAQLWPASCRNYVSGF